MPVILHDFSSFFDAIMVFASGFPYMVNRVENLSIPLMGACIQVTYTNLYQRERLCQIFLFSSTRPSL